MYCVDEWTGSGNSAIFTGRADCPDAPTIQGGCLPSMAMQQEPIDWRYQSHILYSRPIFEAYVLGLFFRGI